MKDYGFKIKVSDLLHSGTIDEIYFENKYLEEIPNIKDGIKGKILLRGINSYTINLKLENIELILIETCEICGTIYERKVNIDEYEVEFILPGFHPYPDEQIHDQFFVIDPKDMTIDIGKVVYDAIMLTQPVTLKCPICINKQDEVEENDDFNIFNKINIGK